MTPSVRFFRADILSCLIGSCMIGSARAVPAPPRRVAPWSGSHVSSHVRTTFDVCACASSDVRPPSPQPCARTGRAVLPRVPHRSPIERSASGASAQQPGPSRSGVLGCGGDGGRGGASRQGWGGRGRAAPVRVRGVGRSPHPPDRAIRLRRNTAFAACPRPGGADERPAAYAHAALRPRPPHPAALKAADVLTASSQTPTPTHWNSHWNSRRKGLLHGRVCAGRAATCCGRADPDATDRVPSVECTISKITVRTKSMPSMNINNGRIVRSRGRWSGCPPWDCRTERSERAEGPKVDSRTPTLLPLPLSRREKEREQKQKGKVHESLCPFSVL